MCDEHACGWSVPMGGGALFAGKWVYPRATDIRRRWIWTRFFAYRPSRAYLWRKIRIAGIDISKQYPYPPRPNAIPSVDPERGGATQAYDDHNGWGAGERVAECSGVARVNGENIPWDSSERNAEARAHGKHGRQGAAWARCAGLDRSLFEPRCSPKICETRSIFLKLFFPMKPTWNLIFRLFFICFLRSLLSFCSKLCRNIHKTFTQGFSMFEKFIL